MIAVDLGVGVAFSLTIVSTVLCVVYGLIYWNECDPTDDFPDHFDKNNNKWSSS